MLHDYFPPAEPTTITVVSCGSMKSTHAMLRWIEPILAEWPRQSWTAWVVDANDASDVKAARAGSADQKSEWVSVDTEDYATEGAVCRLISGASGLVIFAADQISIQVVRSLEGLVSGLVSFPVSDPLAKPFKRSFASFGVTAGI